VENAARHFVQRARWTFAWNYRRFAPHDFVTLEWAQANGMEQDFRRMVRRIRKWGYEQEFGRKGLFIYMEVADLDGHRRRYWVMSGAHVAVGAAIRASTVINRCVVDPRTGYPAKGARWLTRKPPPERQDVLPGLERA
jgi:hypothetical protein